MFKFFLLAQFSVKFITDLIRIKYLLGLVPNPCIRPLLLFGLLVFSLLTSILITFSSL